MHVKTAAVEMKALLEASVAEHGENIKKARWNAQCTDVESLKPYDNTAFCNLIQGVDALIGLVGG